MFSEARNFFPERLTDSYGLIPQKSLVLFSFRMIRLNSEDFSNFLWCLDIIFLTNSYERNDCEVQKMMNFFRIFVNFPHFSRFFIEKLFCAARCSHVVPTKRFLVKFHVGWIVSGRSEVQWKNGFIPKTVQKCDFTRVKIA